MKSHKRQFIEKYWFTSPLQDGLEKELLEAIEKDNPEQFSREDMINFAVHFEEYAHHCYYTGVDESKQKKISQLLTEYLNSPEYLKAKS